jgi:hypothetical protein
MAIIILLPVKAKRRRPTLADGLLARSGLEAQVERAPSRELPL